MGRAFQGTLFSLILVGCVACKTVLEEDYRLAQPKVVVNSLFTTDSTWRVSLMWTKSISEYTGSLFEPVGAGAKVLILDQNRVPIEELKFSIDCFYCYRGDTSPAENENYTIEITLQDETSLRAVSKVPSVVPIADVAVDSVSYSFDETVFVDLYFDDPGSEANFYQVKVLKYINSNYGDEAIPFTPLNPLLKNDYSSDRVLYINDAHFDGEKYLLRLKVKRSGYRGVNSPIRITLQSVSKEYYYYFTTKNLQVNSQKDPFAQPAQIFSNVENGIGVFAGFSSSERVIAN